MKSTPKLRATPNKKPSGRPPFQYIPRSYEDVQQFSRQLRRGEAVDLAYCGDGKLLCEDLRADGRHKEADLIEYLIKRAKLPKRTAPKPEGSYAYVKHNLIRIMREEVKYRQRAGQPFHWGERKQYLNEVLAKMAGDGDLSQLSDAELETLVPDVLHALRQGPDNRPDRRKRPR